MSCGYGSNLRLREFTREFQGDGTTSAHVQSRGKRAKQNPSGAHSPAQPQRPNWKCPGGGYYNDIVRRRDRRDMEKWE